VAEPSAQVSDTTIACGGQVRHAEVSDTRSIRRRRKTPAQAMQVGNDLAGARLRVV
jgi:hypothetical protein